jgi:uncharacterized protein involved in response to NO
MRALLESGFRPLYPLGLAWAAVAVASWVFAPALNHAPLSGPWWHAHEMVWGFLATVAVGFLFTALPNWTGQATPRGAALGALVGCWLLARAGLWLGGRAYAAAATLDVLFFAAAALACLRAVVRARDARNAAPPLLLAALAAADAVYLRAAATGDFGVALRALDAGLLLPAALSAVIGSRIIPHLAAQAVPGLALRDTRPVARAALALLLAGGALHVVGAAPALQAPLLGAAAAALAWQLLQWKPWRIARHPVPAVLCLGYAGVAAGVAALAAQAAGAPLPDTLWIHLLATWGYAPLVLGVATRSSLAHLGRTLRLDRWMLASFALLFAAAAMRLLALSELSLATPALHAAALAWTGACALFVVRFAPWMARRREQAGER